MREKHRTNILVSVVQFYVTGFRQMTVGKTLWAIIIAKLIVMFVILKAFLFPDFLSSKSDTDNGKADYVRQELTQRN